MNVSIKIECECGQGYAFEVEPVNGRVPSAVTCPACGADGTAAANAFLERSLQADPSALVPTAAAPLRVKLSVSPGSSAAPATSASARGADRDRYGATLMPGQTTRIQAQHEARAKMLWGDPPLQVLAYLLSQGFSREDASELVQEFLKERMRTIRIKGIKYVSIDIVLFGVPAVAFLNYSLGGRLPRSRAIGFLAVVGLFGVGLLIKGIGLLLSPKSHSGDASEEIDPDSLFD